MQIYWCMTLCTTIAQCNFITVCACHHIESIKSNDKTREKKNNYTVSEGDVANNCISLCQMTVLVELSSAGHCRTEYRNQHDQDLVHL